MMDPSYALEILLVLVGFASMFIQEKKKKERDAENAKRAEKHSAQASQEKDDPSDR